MCVIRLETNTHPFYVLGVVQSDAKQQTLSLRLWKNP